MLCRFSTLEKAVTSTSTQHQSVCWGCLHGSDIHRQIISDFPSHHHRDRVAGCPSYMAGQRGVPRLIGTAAVTHRMGKWQGRWLRCVASGSVPPFLARWKGRDGEPSLSVHWSRASPPLATVRAKGQLRPTDGSCVCILWSDSFSHPGSESLSLWSVLPPTPGGHVKMAIPLRIPPLMGWCGQNIRISLFLVWCQPHYALLLLLKILLSPAKLKEPSF